METSQRIFPHLKRISLEQCSRNGNNEFRHLPTPSSTSHSALFCIAIFTEISSTAFVCVCLFARMYNLMLIGENYLQNRIHSKNISDQSWLCKMVAFECRMNCIEMTLVYLKTPLWTMVIRSICTFSAYDKHFTANDCVMVFNRWNFGFLALKMGMLLGNETKRSISCCLSPQLQRHFNKTVVLKISSIARQNTNALVKPVTSKTHERTVVATEDCDSTGMALNAFWMCGCINDTKNYISTQKWLWIYFVVNLAPFKTSHLQKDSGVCGFDKRFGCEMDEKWRFQMVFRVVIHRSRSGSSVQLHSAATRGRE